jgi:hypothetical protein
MASVGAPPRGERFILILAIFLVGVVAFWAPFHQAEANGIGTSVLKAECGPMFIPKNIVVYNNSVREQQRIAVANAGLFRAVQALWPTWWQSNCDYIEALGREVKIILGANRGHFLGAASLFQTHTGGEYVKLPSHTDVVSGRVPEIFDGPFNLQWNCVEVQYLVWDDVDVSAELPVLLISGDPENSKSDKGVGRYESGSYGRPPDSFGVMLGIVGVSALLLFGNGFYRGDNRGVLCCLFGYAIAAGCVTIFCFWFP